MAMVLESVTEKDRLMEWLARAADEVSEMRHKGSQLTDDEKLKFIRGNYAVINVLTKVAKREAFMVGVPPVSK